MNWIFTKPASSRPVRAYVAFLRGFCESWPATAQASPASSGSPRRSGRPQVNAAARRKTAAKTAKTSGLSPIVRSGGTDSGARIEAIRPKPAAQPAPVARNSVG